MLLPRRLFLEMTKACQQNAKADNEDGDSDSGPHEHFARDHGFDRRGREHQFRLGGAVGASDHHANLLGGKRELTPALLAFAPENFGSCHMLSDLMQQAFGSPHPETVALALKRGGISVVPQHFL